jgi:hypothetical protein
MSKVGTKLQSVSSVAVGHSGTYSDKDELWCCVSACQQMLEPFGNGVKRVGLARKDQAIWRL